MSFRNRHVLAWLDAKRGVEPSVAESVRRWLSGDVYRHPLDAASMTPAARKFKENNDVLLNISKPKKKERPSNQHLKKTIFFTDGDVAELRGEAERQNRSLSWLIQQAWRISKDKIRTFRQPGEQIDD